MIMLGKRVYFQKLTKIFFKVMALLLAVCISINSSVYVVAANVLFSLPEYEEVKLENDEEVPVFEEVVEEEIVTVYPIEGETFAGELNGFGEIEETVIEMPREEVYESVIEVDTSLDNVEEEGNTEEVTTEIVETSEEVETETEKESESESESESEDKTELTEDHDEQIDEYEDTEMKKCDKEEFHICSPDNNTCVMAGEDVMVVLRNTPDKYKYELYNVTNKKLVKKGTSSASEVIISKSDLCVGCTYEFSAYESFLFWKRNEVSITLNVTASLNIKMYYTQDDGKIVNVLPGGNINNIEDLQVSFGNVHGVSMYKYALKHCEKNQFAIPSTEIRNENITIGADNFEKKSNYVLYVTAYDKKGNRIIGEELQFSVGKYQIKNGAYIETHINNSIKESLDNREAYVCELERNIEELIQAYEGFTTKQKKCLRHIYEEQFSDSRIKDDDLKKYIEFRYEGVGATDLFNAMTVVIKDAEVYGVFFRTSTLPDNYTSKGTGTIKAGIYNMVKHNHLGEYAAFQLRDSQNASNVYLPAIYDTLTAGDKNMTSNGINIHHSYSQNKRNSEGCIVVNEQDWAAYVGMYGFWGVLLWEAKDTNVDNPVVVGKIIIERCEDIVIYANNLEYRENATVNIK